MLSGEAADLCLFVRGVNTVSGANGGCVDRKAESKLCTISSTNNVPTHTTVRVTRLFVHNSYFLQIDN